MELGTAPVERLENDLRVVGVEDDRDQFQVAEDEGQRCEDATNVSKNEISNRCVRSGPVPFRSRCPVFIATNLSGRNGTRETRFRW